MIGPQTILRLASREPQLVACLKDFEGKTRSFRLPCEDVDLSIDSDMQDEISGIHMQGVGLEAGTRMLRVCGKITIEFIRKGCTDLLGWGTSNLGKRYASHVCSVQ